jgi:hypothetical protein
MSLNIEKLDETQARQCPTPSLQIEATEDFGGPAGI